MFRKECLKIAFLSMYFAILGIVMNTSNLKADTSLQNNSDFTVLRINEELSSPPENEQSGENFETEELKIEDLAGLEEYEIRIKGMTCADCETKVKDVLLKCSGVKTAWVSHDEGIAIIEVDDSMINAVEIIAAIEKTGFSYVEEE
jgi:copper chaperone